MNKSKQTKCVSLDKYQFLIINLQFNKRCREESRQKVESKNFKYRSAGQNV